MIKLHILLPLIFLNFLASCNTQNSNTANNSNTDKKLIVQCDTVKKLGKNIMVIYQDKKNIYWFGSWETGIYRYDGINLLNFTTKHGISHNRIEEIKEDELGNIYFNTSSGIVKYDGINFFNLNVIEIDNQWKLEPRDLWFKDGWNSGNVFRYDGNFLYKLKMPKTKIGEEYMLKFPNPNPYTAYCIYKDKKGNIWFGTNPLGVCRYNGKTFDWITEEDVTEFRNEGANGVRSIVEDKNGDFWFNTEFRYSINDSAALMSNKFYTRHKSIGSLDGKVDGDLDEYLSVVIDKNDNLWFVTYRNGVYKYDGTKITHFNVQDNSKDIFLFSIYKDNKGDLWLGTQENGAYKFNGNIFEKFRL